jgi:hypothetical protein
MVRGGKRRGAGRPPLNAQAKTSQLSTRISEELRGSLQKGADRLNISLSEYVARCLSKFLQEGEIKKWGKPHTKSVLAFLARLIEDIEDLTGEQWTDDPFTFEAVRQGLNRFFEMLSPTGNIVRPARVEQRYSASLSNEEETAKKLGRSAEEVHRRNEYMASPEGMGASLANGMWVGLRMEPQTSEPSTEERDDWHYLRIRVRQNAGIEYWFDRNIHPYRRRDSTS